MAAITTSDVVKVSINIDAVLSSHWMFNPKQNGSYANTLRAHFVKLHEEGKIQIITDNLLDENTWDASLYIDIKDMSAYGLVKNIIAPLQTYARFDEIRMKTNNIIEFWWD